jgi:hypothetical protein
VHGVSQLPVNIEGVRKTDVFLTAESGFVALDSCGFQGVILEGFF